MALVFSAPFIAGPTWYSDELVQNSFTYISNISGIDLQYGGPMGSYLYTSNSNKSIKASINFAPKLNSANKLSLSFWLKVDPNDYVDVDPFQQLISLLATSNTVDEERFRLEWDGSGYVWFGNTVTNSTGGAGYNASAWKSNDWNHCILTIDVKESETICNFRVNGINYNTTFPGGSFTFKDYVIINHSQLIFSICDFKIYNHILSEYEMLELERALCYKASFNRDPSITGITDVYDEAARYGNCAASTLSTYSAYTSILGSSSAKFNNNYVRVARSNTLPTEALTVNVWAYMSNWANFANGMRLISCTESGGWNFENSGTDIRFSIYDGSAKAYKGTSGIACSSLASGWHMFTGTFNGTLASFYIDGQLIASGATFTNAPNGVISYNSSNYFIIGAEPGSSTSITSGYYFNGYMNDVEIYGTCFSAKEILHKYKNRGAVDNLGYSHFAQLNENGIVLNPLLTIENMGSESDIDNEHSLTGNARKLTGGNDAEVETYLRSNINPSLDNTHVYYACTYVYSPSSSFIAGQGVDFYWPVSEPHMGSGVISNTITEAGTWQKISARDTRSTFSNGSYQMRFDFNNIASSNTNSIWVDGFLLVDLTDMFGSGNEPDLNWCDKYIDYKNKIVPNPSTSKSIDNKGVIDCTNICECGRRMRYLKITMRNSNMNGGKHFTKLSYNTINNNKIEILDITKSITCINGSIISGQLQPRYSTPAENNYWDVSKVSIFDLGKTEMVAFINMRRYYIDSRYYYQTKLEGSLDNINWFTIWDSYNTGSYGNDVAFNTYVETEQGRWFIVEPEKFEILDNGTIVTSQFIEE